MIDTNDNQIKDCEVVNDQNGESVILMTLDFDHPICGTEIILSREELLYMIDALNGSCNVGA